MRLLLGHGRVREHEDVVGKERVHEDRLHDFGRVDDIAAKYVKAARKLGKTFAAQRACFVLFLRTAAARRRLGGPHAGRLSATFALANSRPE